MFSRRTDWNASLNRLTLARRDAKAPLIDLTETNPTRAGFAYPDEELAEALARGAKAPYSPEPRGLATARETLAAHLGCEPDELLLTSSTSEAYSFLFKLLTDPGDEIVTATPAYPLLEHLAAMELVQLKPFSLELHRRWEIVDSRVRGAITDRTRAIVVVNPNNPTGSFVRPDEAAVLASVGLPIVADEVFLDYPVEASGQTLAGGSELTFTLGGLSKSAGLPHFKLGWIRATGRRGSEALEALEAIADNYLSVATPVQIALRDILGIAPRIRKQIEERITGNLSLMRALLSSLPAAAVLPVEGGWSAILRVPRLGSDEELALELLERGVVVQPGYFFDFETDGCLVVSLLTRREDVEEGFTRIRELISERID